jgi:Uma2 family endonuclease
MHEIVLSDNVKPALEWVNGRVLQKAFAGTKHAIAQARFVVALGEWADQRGSGFAGLEWRFQVQPPGEIWRSLTPDIAYLSYDRYPLEEFESDAAPTVAPDVVVEIRSRKTSSPTSMRRSAYTSPQVRPRSSSSTRTRNRPR